MRKFRLTIVYNIDGKISRYIAKKVILFIYKRRFLNEKIRLSWKIQGVLEYVGAFLGYYHIFRKFFALRNAEIYGIMSVCFRQSLPLSEVKERKVKN